MRNKIFLLNFLLIFICSRSFLEILTLLIFVFISYLLCYLCKNSIRFNRVILQHIEKHTFSYAHNRVLLILNHLEHGVLGRKFQLVHFSFFFSRKHENQCFFVWHWDNSLVWNSHVLMQRDTIYILKKL